MSLAMNTQHARVALPSQLARLANGMRDIPVQPGPLPDVIKQLDLQFPMLRSQIFKPTGQVRQFVGLFVDEEQVHDVRQDAIQVQPGSTLRIVLSVAGG